MASRTLYRPLATGAALLAGVLFAACGSSGDVSVTTAGPTVAPATTTSAAPAPTTTVATTTSAPPTTAARTTTAPPSTGGPVTDPPNTAPRPSIPRITVKPTPTQPTGFTEVAMPIPPDASDPIDPAWVEPSGSLGTNVADGVYWGIVDGYGEGSDPFIDLVLSQVFFGDACVAALGIDHCDGDIGTLDEPSGTLPAWTSDLQWVSVVDSGTEFVNPRAWGVSGDELLALVRGDTVQGAPEGYFYTPFPYIATVQDGQIVALEQIWIS
jgi:hypothetical protein